MDDATSITITNSSSGKSVTTTPEGLQRAVAIAKARSARSRALADPQQTDLEGFTGVSEEQERREAEAGGIAADRLRSIVERIERLEEEKKALAADINDIFCEAKSAGFSSAALKALLKIRRQEPAEVEEQEVLLDLYRRALGM